MRQPIRPLLHLPIRNLHTTHRNRHRTRILRLEQLHHRQPTKINSSVVPLLHHPPPLTHIKHVNRFDPSLRIGDEQFQHPNEPPRDPADRPRIEQVGRPDHGSTHSSRRPLRVEDLTEPYLQVELGHGRPTRQPARPHAGQFQHGLRQVLQVELHLEQRMPGA